MAMRRITDTETTKRHSTLSIYTPWSSLTVSNPLYSRLRSLIEAITSCGRIIWHRNHKTPFTSINIYLWILFINIQFHIKEHQILLISLLQTEGAYAISEPRKPITFINIYSSILFSGIRFHIKSSQIPSMSHQKQRERERPQRHQKTFTLINVYFWILLLSTGSLIKTSNPVQKPLQTWRRVNVTTTIRCQSPLLKLTPKSS